MIAFVLAIFLLILTPGPGVLSLAGVGAAFGWRQGIKYLIPWRQPNAAPTPASDKTPGPGVKINKKIAKTKAIIYKIHLSRYF